MNDKCKGDQCPTPWECKGDGNLNHKKKVKPIQRC